MQVQKKLGLAMSLALLAACSSSSNSPRGQGDNPPTNGNGSPQTGVITAQFNPAVGAAPTPINLAFLGTRDLTLNPTVVNANNFGDPLVALSAQDGWSTVAPWSFKFNSPSAAAPFASAPLASTLVAGQTVRMFEVRLSGVAGAVTSVTRELAANTDFVIGLAASDTAARTVGILPTKPLKQLTSYMVVVTNGITDAAGNNVTPDQPYFLTQRTSPLCTGGTTSTDPLLPASTACALEPLRQLVNAQETAAAAAGVDRSKIVLSWVATTQSITPVLTAVKASTTPATVRVAPTGLTTAAVGAGVPPVADIYIGTISLRYFLTAPSASNPTGPLTGFWKAAPGAYVAPFNAAGLDATSTNLTFANPVPVSQSTQTVPLVLTVPNANSLKEKPAAGWPIVIFNHGITRNRTDALAIAATFAGQGFAVIAIDQPLHGVGATSPFYIETTPFGAIASERTFDLDLSNNTTGAPGPDGVVDGSGTYTINLSSLLTSRDNLRQTVADLFALTASIPAISIDADTSGDFDAARIGFVGQSLGSITGVAFLALEPNVNTALLSVPGGGIARLLDGSASFGPRIRAGLAASGVAAGSPAFDSFMFAAQTAIDSVDPLNFAVQAASTDKILAQLVVGNGGTSLPDQVVPVAVPGQPLAGGEPLVRMLGLTSIFASTQSATGIRGVTRFTAGDHGSLLSPTASLPATIEMQGQMASMIVSNGAAVQVANTSVIRTQ